MDKKKEIKLDYGNMVFIIAILIIIVGGLLKLTSNTNKVVIATLMFLGVVIGILNITNEESVSFMVAGITIVLLMQPIFVSLSQTFGFSAETLKVISQTYANLVFFIVPATIIVAIKTLIRTGKDE